MAVVVAVGIRLQARRGYAYSTVNRSSPCTALMALDEPAQSPSILRHSLLEFEPSNETNAVGAGLVGHRMVAEETLLPTMVVGYGKMAGHLSLEQLTRGNHRQIDQELAWLPRPTHSSRPANW